MRLTSANSGERLTEEWDRRGILIVYCLEHRHASTSRATYIMYRVTATVAWDSYMY